MEERPPPDILPMEQRCHPLWSLPSFAQAEHLPDTLSCVRNSWVVNGILSRTAVIYKYVFFSCLCRYHFFYDSFSTVPEHISHSLNDSGKLVCGINRGWFMERINSAFLWVAFGFMIKYKYLMQELDRCVPCSPMLIRKLFFFSSVAHMVKVYSH